MKNLAPILGALLAAAAVHATDISGIWQAEIDTQIGPQKYRYTFHVDGEKLTGTADVEFNGQRHETKLKEGRFTNDTATFVEQVEFQGNDLRIEYTGNSGTNGISFTRKVGDFATEAFVAKRVAPTNAAMAEHPDNHRDGLRGPGGPIVLHDDDRPAFAEPPIGFDVERTNIMHGTLEMIEYDSKTVGTKRRMQVYLPPGYTADKKFPVLYLLHGIGGDENEWQHFATPNIILDNLIADGKAAAMIVVMPNGRAQKNDRAEGDIYSAAPAFANFERDLLDDVIPTIESRYAAATRREQRALAGLSMGGGQTLNFGLAHPDTFAWLGAFSPAPNTKPPAELLPDAAGTTAPLKLMWLSCGNKDKLIRISQGIHARLKEKNIPHIWHVDDNAHDTPEWKQALYHFSRCIFK